jgi:hypothetical protein
MGPDSAEWGEKEIQKERKRRSLLWRGCLARLCGIGVSCMQARDGRAAAFRGSNLRVSGPPSGEASRVREQSASHGLWRLGQLLHACLQRTLDPADHVHLSLAIRLQKWVVLLRKVRRGG